MEGEIISSLTGSGKATGRMFQSTSDSWTHCCAPLKTHKSEWDSLPSVSESVRATECHVSQHCTDPRRSGDWHRRRAHRIISRRLLTQALHEEETMRQGVSSQKRSWMSCKIKLVVDSWLINLIEAEAKLRFPNLVVASLDKPGGVVTARVLLDGTHGLEANTRTRIRDQERPDLFRPEPRDARERAPSHPDLRAHCRGHRGSSANPYPPQGLAPPREPSETRSRCVHQHGGPLGVPSASYCWSRVSAELGRLTQCLASDRAQTWHMVADDYHLEAGGQSYRFALLCFFVLCLVVGVPLSRHKTSSGDSVVWVGFELLHQTRHLGISQRRAEWFMKWAREVAAMEFVHVTRFEEGLGRIMLVMGAPSSDHCTGS